MPAERKKSGSMDEKEVSSFSSKEKESSERRPATSRERGRDEAKPSSKREGVKTSDEKKKKLEEEKRKKEEKERKKKEEEKTKAEEEQKRKEEEEKRKQEEEEKRRQEEEQKRQREEEVAELKEKEEAHQVHQEAWERHQCRKEFRGKNQNAQDNRPEENFFSRLDSSLKKNTAFVKKLKTITEQQRDSLSNDFNSLNLSKYIAEAVTSVVEAKLKISDVNCAVHLCSLFHQRYVDFAPLLLQAWRKHFEARKEEKTPNISKLRTDLRFIAELTIVGIFTDKEGLSLIYEQIKNIINADRESHTHVSVVISFCRHCGDDIAGLVPRKVKLAAEKFNLEFPPSEIISTEKQQPFQNLLREYFTSLTKHLKRDHRELQNIERQNRRILHSKGELSEDRHKQYEEFATTYQKLLANTQSLADLLDENMPELPQDKTAQEEHGTGIDIFTPGKPGEYDLEGGIWEDEDARNFYENLIDLKAVVPAILFKDNEKTAQNKDTNKEDSKVDSKDIKDSKEVSSTEELEMELENMDINEDNMELEAGEDTEDLTKKLLDEQEQEDEEASTGSHLKLIVDAFLQQLPNCVNRDLIDKAAMDFCMNMNTKANRRKLVRALFTVPRQRLDLLPFYSRLVATLHPCMCDVAEDLCSMLKGDFRFHMLLSDFSHHHIEMACTLLETCGRFLFRTPESHLRTSVLLEQMMRKKQAMHLDARYVTMVENAYYYCNPPPAEKTVRKKRPPLQEYIRKLLYKDLSKVTTEKVNQPKFNQRRISSVKFLGELYNYRMVESAVIFRTLYSFISFGVNTDGTSSPLDPPEHLFRIRLVCTVLDTCGQYFDRGSSKRKLDCFLIYFQRYVWWKKSLDVWTKEHPFPIDIDYMISDTLELLRPKMKLCSSLEEALRQVQELEHEFLVKLGLVPDKDSKVCGSIAEGEALEEDDDEEDEEGGAETEEQSGNESEMNEPEEEVRILIQIFFWGGGPPEVMIKGGGLKHIPCAEDEEFIQALDKMMLENLQQRTGESVKVHQLDVAIPLHLKSQLKKAPPPSGGGEGDAENTETMPFVMLTRKGNKQQFKILNVPMSSQLAANHWNQQQAEQEERMRMKKLTLDINERQEQEDYQEMLQSLAQRPAPANTNRERRPRYQHPKGAPNADLIFKTGGR
nr:PREDICTED: regulator of nonsense transcripts 2 [Latimeria chalumnae]|eukprot:XP_014342624.1 PREDICTED: regulator of nonsense transcripts 2 [Latimeria chalumnae]